MSNRTTPWLLLAAMTVGCAAHAGEPQTDKSAAATDVTISGMKVAVDPATGRMRPLTAEENQRLSSAVLKSARADARAMNMPLNASEARATKRVRADGSVSVKAPLSSMTEMRASIGADGKVTMYEAQPGSESTSVQGQEEVK